MKYKSLLALMAMSSSLWAQKEQTLQDFKKIELDIPVKVILVSGAQNKVSHPKSLDGLSFEVKNQTLHIDYSGNSAPDAEPIEVYYTTLISLEVSGAGNVETKTGSKISTDNLELECSGASKVNLEVMAKKLHVISAGASKITLKGDVANVSYDLSGATKLHANDLTSKSVKIVSAGATYFNVNVSEDFVVDASGMSNGVYSGNPKNRTVNVTGSSNIIDAATGENMSDEREARNSDDTTRITVGKKKLIIIEDDAGIRIEQPDAEDEKDLDIDIDKPKKDDDGKSTPKKKKYELKKVYDGFEVGVNQFTNPNLDFKVPTGYEFLDCKLGNSWFYSINPLEGDVQLIKNKLAITSGLGMEFQNFNFKSDRVLTANVNGIMADSGLTALNTNKLYAFNLNVPLLIKYAPRTKKERNNFHFAAGVIGTFKAYSHVRTETTAMGYKEQRKYVDDFEINPFRLTATARVGYGWFRVFANYSLTPYFNRSNNNPDIRVFSAGLTLGPIND